MTYIGATKIGESILYFSDSFDVRDGLVLNDCKKIFCGESSLLSLSGVYNQEVIDFFKGSFGCVFDFAKLVNHDLPTCYFTSNSIEKINVFEVNDNDYSFFSSSDLILAGSGSFFVKDHFNKHIGKISSRKDYLDVILDSFGFAIKDEYTNDVIQLKAITRGGLIKNFDEILDFYLVS